MRLAALLLPLLLACTPAEPADEPIDGGGADGSTDGTSTDGVDGTGGSSADGTDGTSTDGADGTGGTTVTSGTRGVWAWRDAGDPWGTDAVVGDPVAEDAAIAALIDWGVDRVYGSYGDRPLSEPEVIADWNEKLHAAGIQSHVLMGDPAWTSSREWANMEAKILDRLLDYNASRSLPEERFDGLHLDIEPHASSTWSSLDEAGKYGQIFLLDAAYDFARTVMDGHSAGPGLTLAADQPVWYDTLPPALGGTGQVGWPSTTARTDWYAEIGASLDSLSMMAYETDDLSTIQSRVAFETATFPNELRVGLNEEVGTTWTDIDEMFDMADDLEGVGYPVDLHSFSKIQAQLP